MGVLFGDALRAVRSAGGAAGDAARRAADVGSQARNAVVDIGAGAIDRGIAARDSITGTVESIGQYARTAKDVASTVSFYGLAISAVAAPIPTLIGALLMEMMLASVRARIDGAHDGIAAGKIARDNARILDRLAKFGKIPATAIAETGAAILRFDTVAATVDGEFKAGPFAGRALSGMTDHELRSQASTLDPETAKLIDGYLNHRAALAEG